MYRLLLALLFVICLWPGQALAETKIGLVDGDQLFDDYQNAQNATQKISNLQDELRDLITDSEKVYSEFEKQKKSEAEKLTKQKELQSRIDLKAKETKKAVEALSKGVEQEILQAIKSVALKKGLEAVIDKRAVLYGGTDVTSSVLEELKKKAPLAKEPGTKEEDKETN